MITTLATLPKTLLSTIHNIILFHQLRRYFGQVRLNNFANSPLQTQLIASSSSKSPKSMPIPQRGISSPSSTIHLPCRLHSPFVAQFHLVTSSCPKVRHPKKSCHSSIILLSSIEISCIFFLNQSLPFFVSHSHKITPFSFVQALKHLISERRERETLHEVAKQTTAGLSLKHRKALGAV